MACPCLWQGRHLLREQCGICRNDTNAEVKMVLRLSTNNKECIAAWEVWPLSKFKDLLQVGLKSCYLLPLITNMFAVQALRSGREVVMADVCYQFTGFQNKHCLILVPVQKMLSRSGNTFARHFQSMIFFTPDMNPSFKFHYLGSERWRYLKHSPTSYKTTSFFSFDVYLGRAERPSFWPFDSCESQSDLSLSWVAAPYLDSNWVFFAASGQLFVSSALILCSASNWCVLCVSANTEDKQKLIQAWTGATLLCLLCSRSVEMKPSALSLYISLMLWCTRPFVISWSLTC